MAKELIDIIYDLCENGVPSYDFVLEWLRGQWRNKMDYEKFVKSKEI